VERDDDWDHDYYWLLHDAALYKEAEEYCRRALNGDPSNEEPMVFLAHILGVHLDRLDEAVALLLQALASNPTDVNLNFFLGGLYEQQEKYLEAEMAYKKTLNGLFIAEERARLSAILADLYLRNLSRPEAARAALADAVTEGNDNDDVQRKVSSVFLLDNDLESAEKHARRAVELNTEISNFLQLGEVLIRRGKWAEAGEHIALWLRKTSGTWIRENWSTALPVLRSLVAEGRASEFGVLLQAREDEKVLRSLGRALASPDYLSTNGGDDCL
jgi:tetratricopeptide (TPR) repeat protein